MAILNNFYQSVGAKYGITNKKTIAKYMFDKTVDIGTAVVNVLSATGIAGFKFHVPETEIIKLENDITDHYVDNGTTIQDHIARKPIILTLDGLVGDYFYTINEIEDLLALVTPTISLVKEFLPVITETAQLFKLKSLPLLKSSSNNVISGGVTGHLNLVDLFETFQNLYKLKSAQTRAFIFFECLWKSRELFSVETTWKRYDNMAVQSIQAKRDNNADITEFSVTVKQINFAQTETETVEQYTNRIQQEKAKITNKGQESGEIVKLPLIQLPYEE